MKPAKYPVRVQFLTTEDQKRQFEYINAIKYVDSSNKIRELIADYILENYSLLPDELKFKPQIDSE